MCKKKIHIYKSIYYRKTIYIIKTITNSNMVIPIALKFIKGFFKKIVGITKKEQIQTILNKVEFKKFKDLLEDIDNIRDIQKELTHIFKTSQLEQFIFISEQELYFYIKSISPNANIVLFADTKDIDLYIVVSGAETRLYAVIKPKEDLIMHDFKMWLGRNFWHKKILKSVLCDYAISKFNIKNKVFYSRISYIRRKVFNIDISDKKYYYIGTSKKNYYKQKKMRQTLHDKFYGKRI